MPSSAICHGMASSWGRKDDPAQAPDRDHGDLGSAVGRTVLEYSLHRGAKVFTPPEDARAHTMSILSIFGLV